MLPALLCASLTLAESPAPAAANQAALDAARDFAGRQAVAALALYREVAGEPGNLVLSPLSIARCLAMVREGASGETAAELDRALHLDPEREGLAFQTLAAELVRGISDKRPQFELDLSAAAFRQRDVELAADFLERLRTRFDAEAVGVDFRDPERARASINGWVDERTRGKIPEIVPPGTLGPDARLVLVDAAYFRAPWAEAFYERATQAGPFHAPEGDRTAPFMRRTDSFPYATTPLATVVEIPYRGGTTSMVVVLPNEGTPLAEVVAKEDVAAWTQALASRRVALELPKFRFEWGANVRPALERLGVHRAFDRQRAEFERTGGKLLSLDQVLHRALIEVDENGTVAAAATAAVLRAGSAAPIDEPVKFRADRPFLFLLRHRATGAVLFLGRVEQPAESAG